MRIAWVILIILFLPCWAIGQQKPFWAKGVFYNAPNSDIKSFEATGKTETEARNAAAAKVIEWKSGATGLHSQVIIRNGVVVVNGADELTVKAREIANPYYEKLSSRQEVRAHILVQIAKYPSSDFDDVVPILQQIEKRQLPFFLKKHNNYLAWGIINIGYPWTAGTSFIGRHGDIIGVGYYLTVGVDFGGKSTYPKTDKLDQEFIAPLHYSVGLKFFPYKNAFLSAGYGTLGCEKMMSATDSDGRWNTEGWRQGKGFTFGIGYDVLGNLAGSDGGAFFSPSMGLSYDTFTGKWKPLINIKIGLAFGLE